MWTTIGIAVSVIALILGAVFVFSLLKVSSDFDDASDELYRNQLNYMMDMEKVKRHKKMLDEANQNPEYIDKE
jgi:hypothetical protein